MEGLLAMRWARVWKFYRVFMRGEKQKIAAFGSSYRMFTLPM
jgi:hypothetical protein